MKVRLAFVSNSSSSSCVLLGTMLPYVEAVGKDYPKDTVAMIGIDLGDGTDLVYLNDEIRRIMLKHPTVFRNYHFMEISAISNDREEITINKSDFKEETITVIPIEVDYHTTEDGSVLQERYLGVQPEPEEEDLPF